MVVTDDLIKNTMDLLTVMAVEEIAADLDISQSEALTDFLLSRTGHMLYDDSYKLWWDGPSAIAQAYKDERKAASELMTR